MREIVLDEAQFENVNAIHDYLAQQLNFPSYYGNNLAALEDSLGNISEPILFIIERVRQENLQALGNTYYESVVKWDDFTRVCRVIMRSVRDNPNLHALIEC